MIETKKAPQLQDANEVKDHSKGNSLDPQFEFSKAILAEEIIDEVEHLQEVGNQAKDCKGLFIVRTASHWIEQAKTRPIPKKLFSEFWHEGELCILFADTNLGKSIKAVQIGDSISTGICIPGFKLETEKQVVLYFDFELSDKQFENRYSERFANHYQWSDNFIRVEINPDAEFPENTTFEDFLNQSLELSIKETGAKVLIIDNLTYLKNETEKAKDALPLMKHLKALKSKYGLSILALAHTPKRDLSKPITRNDLSGSKMLINFCDSSFAIGESSTDKNLRYLKQIKARSTEIIYDSDNVCVCQISKASNFLKFDFLHFGTEQEHLRQYSENEKSEIEKKVKEMLESEPAITAYAIAKKLCMDESKFNSFKVKINRIVNRISNSSNSSNT
jgi:RecA-family ATPase